MASAGYPFVIRKNFLPVVTNVYLNGITNHPTRAIHSEYFGICRLNQKQGPISLCQLVRHYQRPLFAYLGRMGIRQANAEAIAQETFLRAWKHMDHYEPSKAPISTWLFSIARNLTLNHLKKSPHFLARIFGLEAAEEIESEQLTPPQLLQQQEMHNFQKALRR